MNASYTRATHGPASSRTPSESPHPAAILIDFIKDNDFTSLKDHLSREASCPGRFDLTQACHSIPDEHCVPHYSLPSNNLTLLHLCAVFDALECFICLSQRKSVSNLLRIRSGASYTPLHYACQYGSLEVAHYILACDREQRFLGEHQIPLLTLAAEAPAPRIVKLLLAGVTEPPAGFDDAAKLALRNHDYETLGLLNPFLNRANSVGVPLLVTAVRQHAWDTIERLLELGCDPANSDKMGELPLELAVLGGAEPAILRLICNKSVSIDVPSGRTGGGPVHWLCRRGSLDVADLLLSYKIVLDGLDERGNVGPVRLFSYQDEGLAIQIMERLLKAGFDINAPSRSHSTLLDLLAEYKLATRPVLAKWLIEHGATGRVAIRAIPRYSNAFAPQVPAEGQGEKPDTAPGREAESLSKPRPAVSLWI
jgi:ankyrin repeat protein